MLFYRILYYVYRILIYGIMKKFRNNETFYGIMKKNHGIIKTFHGILKTFHGIMKFYDFYKGIPC